MEKRNLYIIVAVVLVVGLTLSFSNLTGNYVSQNPVLGECIDTDLADDPETPGSVRYENEGTEYLDECYSKSNTGPKKYLKERYCVDRMKTQKYLCYGGCAMLASGQGYCLEGGYNPIKSE